MRIIQYLCGGDRRSIGRSNEVVRLILMEPARFPELMACLWSGDELVSMRAADAIEKLSAQRPEWLQPFAAELLGLADETEQKELRWHLAQLFPRLRLTKASQRRAFRILRRYLEDRSSIVKTFALDALAQLLPDPVPLLEKMARTGTPAMRARSRKLQEKFNRESPD